MKLKAYLSSGEEQKNPGIKCNALSKTAKSFNCQLSSDQAIDLARYLLNTAQLIRQSQIEDAAVQLWCVGENSETLSVGLIELRKGSRRMKAKAAVGDSSE